MPRSAWASVGGMWYHALNRGNRREVAFHKPGDYDYDAFVEAMVDARKRLPVDLLGYCLMPNHFHLLFRPHQYGDLGRWMQWLLTAHARRYHRPYGTTGHVWQGRFKIRVHGTIVFMEPTTTRTPEPHGDPTTMPVVTEYIGIRPGYCGGEPHILGHRIKVRHIAVWHDQMGMTPTEIAATYPTITLAQVHAALAYYYDHRDEIWAAIEDEHHFVEELKAKSPQSKLQQLLSARKPDAPDDSLPPG